jgi:catecholate siderophore receptor
MTHSTASTARKTDSTGSRTFAKTLAFMPSLLVAGSLGAQSAEPAAPAAPAPVTPNDTVELPAVTVEGASQPGVSSPKFTAPLLDTPQTVVVISREVFEQQGATTLRDVLRNTPGITFAAGEGGTANGDQMSIRGFDSRTDIFVDGIRDTGTYTRDAFNLEQVEVIKGPSSAVSGRGSTGASINLVTKTPRLETFRAVTAGIGTDDYYRATLDVNQALPDSPVVGTAVRVNGLWQDAGVAGRDEVENKTWAIAPSLALGLGTATRATLSLQHMEQDNVPDYGLPWVPTLTGDTGAVTPGIGQPGGKPNVDQSNWYGLKDRDYEEVVSDTFTIGLEHDLTADTTLRNTTRYSRVDRDSVMTAPRFVISNPDGSLPSAPTGDGVVQPLIRRSDWKSRDEVTDILANNLNLTSSFDTGFIEHNISTGLELSRETSRGYGRAYPPGTVFPDTSVFNPNPDDVFNAPLTRDGSVTDATAESVGVYVFDTLKLSDRWQLNGGLRWDRFDVDYYTRTAATAVPPSVETELSRTDKMLSWKAGAVFKPRPNGSIFVGYGNSFNPSAEGLALSDGTGRTPANINTAPEESRSMEIGTKWDFYNNRLSLSAALFRTDKVNARVADPTTPTVSVLDGEQRVQGIELGASGFITREWNVFAGYVYMDSEIRESSNPLEEGSRIARTPQHSFNVWTTYTLPFGLTLGGGAQYMGEVNRSTTPPITTVDSYLIYSAVASYEVNKNLTLRLNVNNITDEEYVDRVGGGHYIPGATRSFILTAIYAF